MREKFIDYAKAICIITVILDHVRFKLAIQVVFVAMIVFFFASGIRLGNRRQG